MTDFDVTVNRVPFGLLTAEEKVALKAWPHGWKFYSTSEEIWYPCDGCFWSTDIIYRGKPALVVTSVWYNKYRGGQIFGPHTSRKNADFQCSSKRIGVLRIDTFNGVETAHLEGL